jgi:3-oxoacyl-[acyl-carrier-protein] synthase-3
MEILNKMNFTKSRGMKNPGVKILGTGSFLPGQPISNKELLERFPLDTTDQWIKENLGIKQRHFAKPSLAASHLGYEAAKIAIQNAGISPQDLDRILFCSSTSDWTSPAAASNVQALLGADCPAEDKQVACSSFMFGLDHGMRLIATGLKHVLVIGSDVKSRFTNEDDMRLLPIFADGAGGVVLSACEKGEGFLFCELWTDGTKVNNIITPAGGSAMPASMDTVKKNLHTIKMNVDGKVIFHDAIDTMTKISNQVCQEVGIKPEEIDLFIPHQANLSLMNRIASNLNIPSDRIVVTIDHTANIVSATLPYSLDFAYKTGRIKKGMRILLVTAGAGYSAGAAIYQEI